MENKTKKKMPTDIKVFLGVCVVIVCILIAAVVYLIKPKDVASVQNNKVTSDEFKYYFSQNIQMLAQYATSTDDQQSMIDYAKQMALSQAIEVEYLLIEAKKEGFKADQKELDDGWAEMEKNIAQSAETYGVTVKEFSENTFGVSMNKMKAIYVDAVTAQEYKNGKIDSTAVDETELAAFYEENKASFDYNSVSHILISCAKDAEDAVVQEKNKAAQDILDRVNKGEDFAALAKEFSEDDGSKDTGGVYQVRQDKQFVPEFEAWAFEHKVGETGIVRTDHGFHVMKLDSIFDSLESNKENIAMSYKADKFQTSINEVLNGDTLKIEVLDGYEEFQF